jgi:aminomethyltransferase
MSDANKSVLTQIQEQQGATFMQDGDWYWTVNLGDPQGEYEAIRAGVSLWDVYALQKWEVTGPDAAAAVQRVFTNNVATLAVGQVRYGAFVDDAGQMIDDGTVYKLADDHYWVMVNSDVFGDELTGASPGADIQVAHRTHQMPVISVQGPLSRQMLQSLTDADLGSLGYFRFIPERVQVAGVPVWVLRTGFSGELGFELIPDPDDAVALWSTLCGLGARPIGLDAVEVARIEAGLIIMAVDYQVGETSPFDVGLDKTVATAVDTGVRGREALLAAAAAPPNRFKTLTLAGSEVPEYGAEVFHADEVVGTVTSPASSPGHGVIGLAILRSDVADNGTSLEVAVGQGRVKATVTDLSIHDPDKSKPRS